MVEVQVFKSSPNAILYGFGCMVLDFMNPYWLEKTSLVITDYSLLANTFVMSLIEQLSKEIGLSY